MKCQLFCPKLKKKITSSFDKKGGTQSFTTCGSVNWCSHFKGKLAFFFKSYLLITLRFSNYYFNVCNLENTCKCALKNVGGASHDTA